MSQRKGPGKHDVAVTPVSFTKAELDRAPPAHRALHFALGQMANEIVILRNVMWLAINSIRPPEPLTAAAQSTALLAARMMAGRLHDAHDLINKVENGPLLDELWGVFSEAEEEAHTLVAAKAARKALNKYFGRSHNFLSKVRNSLAFHLDHNVLEAGYQLLEEDQEFTDHHTGKSGSTIFSSSDTVMAGALASAGGFKSPATGYQTLIDDVLDLSSQLIDFIDGYMLAFVLTYLGREKLQGETVWIRNAPRFDRATIPLYMSTRGVKLPARPEEAKLPNKTIRVADTKSAD